MGQTPDIGSLYQHYKGNVYRVIGIAKQSETLEDLVLYQEVGNGDKLWARPLAIFIEDVEVDGERVPRFSRMKDSV